MSQLPPSYRALPGSTEPPLRPIEVAPAGDSQSEGRDAAAEQTFQEALLAEGWAKVFVFRHHPFSRVEAFREAASRARAAKRGVWRLCGGDFRRAQGPPRPASR